MTAEDKDIIECYKNSHDDKYVDELFKKYAFIPIVLFKNENLSNQKSSEALTVLIKEIKNYLKRHSTNNITELLYDRSLEVVQRMNDK